jgi:hypothetical protein
MATKKKAGYDQKWLGCMSKIHLPCYFLLAETFYADGRTEARNLQFRCVHRARSNSICIKRRVLPEHREKQHFNIKHRGGEECFIVSNSCLRGECNDRKKFINIHIARHLVNACEVAEHLPLAWCVRAARVQ